MENHRKITKKSEKPQKWPKTPKMAKMAKNRKNARKCNSDRKMGRFFFGVGFGVVKIVKIPPKNIFIKGPPPVSNFGKIGVFGPSGAPHRGCTGTPL